MKEVVVCPKCHSDQIGLHGTARTVQIICLKCGNTFEAGNGSLKITDGQGGIQIVEQKKKEKIDIGLLLSVLVIFAFLVVFLLYTTSQK